MDRPSRFQHRMDNTCRPATQPTPSPLSKNMVHQRLSWILSAALLIGLSGCPLHQAKSPIPDHQVGPYQEYMTEIEYPDVDTVVEPQVAQAARPRVIENPKDQEAWNLTLAECVRVAMSNSRVIRNIGGTVVAGAAGAPTIFDPALMESNPGSSVEAALSAFDAQLSSSIFWNKRDRPVNQTFNGLFTPVFQQLDAAYVMELAKTTATGAKFSLRNHINYTRSEVVNPSLKFNSIYDVDYEAEFRQPLLQGAGVDFNRIAGPNSSAGGANGVLLARINTDISLADFEANVTNLVRDVETAYWDLYFGYRDLEAKIKGRDSALVTWRNIAERYRIGLRGGTPENEAQLRSQYFSFQAAVEGALSTLYSREERLRYLLGLPANGPKLIRPATEPSAAKVVFPWEDVVTEGMLRRVELRRQKWRIKQRELELIAARNYLKPRLDAVALYRWRGLGDDLIGPRGPTGFENAYENLTTGDYQEWQLGLQLNMPIGFRREFTAMRNAELRLARERAVIREQEYTISHELSDAIRSMDRAYQLMKTNLNRGVAAYYEVQALRARFDVGFEQLDVLLRAEQRLADSNIAYYRSLVDHMLAIRDVHLAKGSLLEFDGVSLAEGPWSSKSYRDALERSRHFTPRSMDYRICRPRSLSLGPYPQEMEQPATTRPTPAVERPTPEGAAAEQVGTDQTDAGSVRPAAFTSDTGRQRGVHRLPSITR